jgi:hypothetical protein
MKQTLEEAAERLVKETTLYGSQEASIGSSARSYFETELRCVLLGMQWQQERSYSEKQMDDAYDKGFKDAIERRYSEEEVFNILIEFSSIINLSFSRDPEFIFTWFEQFKKK